MKITDYIIEGVTEKMEFLLNAALTMAAEAGNIHLKYFRTDNLGEQTKQNDSDVVTIADKQSECAIIDYIHRHFPTHSIISEESGTEQKDNEWRWIIDPLDGTTNFASGLPAFCVSIALEHRGEAVLGVVFAPYLGECFYAVKGHGAYLNGTPIHCSQKTELTKAVVATGMPYDRSENVDNNLREISRMVLRVRGVRRMGSAAIDLAYTAAGFLDGYWELNLNHWDVAAGKLIATEAGAIVRSIRENRNHSIMAATPTLSNRLYDILMEHGI